MIEIKKGDNIIAISTAVISTILGHNGRGMFPYRFMPGHDFLLDVVKANEVMVITKSWTHEAHQGNYSTCNPWSWRYIRRLFPRSMVNAYGLTNYGVETHWQDSKKSIQQGINICPSLYPELDQGKIVATEKMLEMINCCCETRMVEVNFSCVNSKENVGKNNESILHCLTKIREARPDIVIIAKMNIEHTDQLYKEIELHKLADALHLFNSVRYDYLFPGQKSSLPNGAGGVSGAHIKKICYKRFVGVRQLSSLPLIAGGGIESLFDIKQYLKDGAGAVSLCTTLAYDLKAGARMIRFTVAGDS